jgi:polysaccharide deacetylase 2 family uncharacterized protein YibQ
VTRHTRLIRPGFVLFWALGTFIALTGGCQKQRRPSPGEIHSITKEFAAALKATAPADVRSELSASYQDSASFDRINVTVRGDSSASSRAVVYKLLRAMNGVATRHHLSRDGPLESREGLLYAYRRAGVITHMVHFHEKIEVNSTEAPTPQPNEAARQKETARLAIILDDLGNDRAAADAIFALQCPITLSVLPNHPHSAEIAQEARRRGLQVMLHLPMESVGNERPEARELRPGMSASDVSTLVSGLLQAVPDVAGVNNHQGSQSTADAALMNELMPVLREHNLFYVDSRTTAATVAYDTAQRCGVRSGFRNVPFLDDVAEVSAVRKQVQLALRDARKKGEAIAIGHPHPATLQALRELLPDAKAQGVRLVFASEVVH